MPSPQDNDLLTEKIIGFAIEVHRQLGPGLLESAYEECLCYELKQNSIPFRRQVPLPVVYKAVRLDCGYRMDIVVDAQVILELKNRRATSASPRGSNAHLHEAERHPHR